MKRALFLFLLFFSFALALKPAWEGEIEEDEDVVLNNQESKTVILKRKPDEEGNIFKQQEGSRGLIYRTSDGGSSTLTLQKDPSLKDMSYYYRKSYHSKSRLSFDYGFKQHRG